MKEPYPSRLLDRFVLRLPDGMREAVALKAKANNRSMNAEIVARLEASLAEHSGSPQQLSFDEGFRAAIKEAGTRLRTLIIEEPELLLGLPLFKVPMVDNPDVEAVNRAAKRGAFHESVRDAMRDVPEVASEAGSKRKARR